MGENQFLIIPYCIYSNTKISNNAKLLYGLLLLLSHKEGFCYATNKFLGIVLNVSSRTITALIKELKNENIIEVINDKKCIRRIYLKIEGIEENFHPP